MNAKFLYEHANEIREALKEAPGFQSFVEDWLSSERKELESGTDSTELYRSQGRIEILKRFVGLKKELDEYIKNKTTQRGT